MLFFLQELEIKRQGEVDGLRADLNRLTSDLEKLDIEVRKLTASKQQVGELIATEEKSTDEKKAAHKVIKQTLALLPEADSNIAKLQVRKGEDGTLRMII